MAFIGTTGKQSLVDCGGAGEFCDSGMPTDGGEPAGEQVAAVCRQGARGAVRVRYESAVGGFRWGGGVVVGTASGVGSVGGVAVEGVRLRGVFAAGGGGAVPST